MLIGLNGMKNHLTPKRDNQSFQEIFLGQGYIKFELPNNNYMDDFSWNTVSEFKAPLSRNSKRCLNFHILRNMDKFDLVINENPSTADIEHWYQLYDNIRKNNKRKVGAQQTLSLIHI